MWPPKRRSLTVPSRAGSRRTMVIGDIVRVLAVSGPAFFLILRVSLLSHDFDPLPHSSAHALIQRHALTRRTGPGGGLWGEDEGLLNAWQTRLSVALQKGNAACLLQAGRVRGSADLQGGTGWEEDIEDLLQEAAAGAGLGVAA